MMRIIRGFGRGLRNGLVALGALAFLGTAVGLADYAVTQGSGTNFASVVISTVHYAASVICDATAGETQCAAVNSHGALDVDTATTNNNLYAAITAPPAFPTLALGQTLVSGTTAAMTGTSSTQVVAAVAAKRLYITHIKCNDSSLSIGTAVQIQDGSGGTVLDTLVAGSNFSGEADGGSTPLFWTTAGNGLFAQNVTTGASVICTGSGYSG